MVTVTDHMPAPPNQNAYSGQIFLLKIPDFHCTHHSAFTDIDGLPVVSSIPTNPPLDYFEANLRL